MTRHRTRLRLAPLAAAVVLALAAGSRAFIDTHLDEIAEPLGDYADARVAEIDQLPSQDKATKKERKLLAKLSKKEARLAADLKGDFKELVLGGKTAKKLKDAAVPMRDALDEAFERAELALGERREFVGDHVLLISNPNALKKIQKKLDQYVRARADADAAEDDLSRAKALAKAEKSVTAALKRAEKDAQKAVNETPGLTMPPIRLRSGDVVGSGGARVAIPVDADSPIAGASVLIPPGALVATSTITLEPGDSFVSGRDSPMGPAVRCLPAGLSFNQPIRVAVPFQLPPDVDPNDVALFHETGSGVTATLDVTIEGNGTLSGEATSFSQFQAGLLAPPLGAPSGKYHVHMLFVAHVLSPDGSSPSQENVGVTGQDWTFRADGGGRRDPGTAPLVFRGFTALPPFHIDGYSAGLSGSVDYSWELVEPGRFSFDFPTEFGDTATAEGIVSETGDVIAFTGRGGEFEFIGVGVRDGVTASNADLDGRWLAVEMGVRLAGADQTTFTAEHVSSFTSFEADGEAATLSFSHLGESFLTRRVFTAGSTASHTVTTTGTGDGGNESFLVLSNGQVSSDDGRRQGWIHPDAGVFVSTHAAPTSTDRAVTLMVAVRQPDSVAPETFQGDYRVARLDLTPREDGVDAFRSFLDVDPGVGTFAVDGNGGVTFTMETVTRAAYALSGPPSSGEVDWRSSVALSDATPGVETFDLALDPAGNDRSGGADRWYGVSGDGSVLLGTTQSSTDLRSLVIGLK